jgi:hypothetical protein
VATGLPIPRDKLLLLRGWYLAILNHHLYKYGRLE